MMRHTLSLTVGVLVALGAGIAVMSNAGASTAAQSVAGAWRFSFPGLEGGTVNLARYRGRVLLIVNTASKCGFTYQYEGLQALHSRYQSRGLTVIGVPSNDFGGQEPGSNTDIAAFCSGTYGVTFPMTGKANVRGSRAHPFYQWAAAALGRQNVPRWNFHKYLVGRDGRLLQAFGSTVEPQNATLMLAVEAALAKPGS